MIENAQPIIYGTLGISGVEIVSSNTFNDTLSIILQIIIAAGTLYKLYLDRNQRRKNKTGI
jgi:xanthine/uracil permease